MDLTGRVSFTAGRSFRWKPIPTCHDPDSLHSFVMARLVRTSAHAKEGASTGAEVFRPARASTPTTIGRSPSHSASRADRRICAKLSTRNGFGRNSTPRSSNPKLHNRNDVGFEINKPAAVAVLMRNSTSTLAETFSARESPDQAILYPSQMLLGIGSPTNAASSSVTGGVIPAISSSMNHWRTCWPQCQVVRSITSCRLCGP
jgi:hypothetical protein